MRSGACNVFVNLSPYEFRWIEFGGAGRKFVHVKTGMLRHEIFYLPATMNRMLIPHQYNWCGNAAQQLGEKPNHLLSGDCFTIGLKMQLYLAPRRCHPQRPNQVQTLIRLQTRANRGRLSARCPCAFEWRDQGKPAFIEENQSCAQALPLFLYAARHNVSNVQRLAHRALNYAVVVFGNSNRGVATNTTRCSNDSVPERDPR